MDRDHGRQGSEPLLPSGFQRIAIVGNNGSGKSFLARELAAVTGLPLVHLDREYWRPNWTAPSPEEWAARQRELVAGDRWIIDGNHSGTMELRFRRAQLVILLDRNRLACLAGVARRLCRPRPDLPPGLTDRVDRGFFLLLKGLWAFPKTRRTAIVDLHRTYPQVAFWVIRNKKEMRRLLENRWAKKWLSTQCPQKVNRGDNAK